MIFGLLSPQVLGVGGEMGDSAKGTGACEALARCRLMGGVGGLVIPGVL